MAVSIKPYKLALLVNSYSLSASSIELFERMSYLDDEPDRLDMLHDYLEGAIEGFNEDPEATTRIMYEMYKEWKSERDINEFN